MGQLKADAKVRSLCWPLFVIKSLQKLIETQPPGKDPNESTKWTSGRNAMETASKARSLEAHLPLTALTLPLQNKGKTAMKRKSPSRYHGLTD